MITRRDAVTVAHLCICCHLKTCSISWLGYQPTIKHCSFYESISLRCKFYQVNLFTFDLFLNMNWGYSYLAPTYLDMSSFWASVCVCFQFVTVCVAVYVVAYVLRYLAPHMSVFFACESIMRSYLVTTWSTRVVSVCERTQPAPRQSFCNFIFPPSVHRAMDVKAITDVLCLSKLDLDTILSSWIKLQH